MSDIHKSSFKVLEEYALHGSHGGGLAFLKQLLRVIHRLYTGKLNSYNRALPVGELLVDRWEKAKSLNFGQGSSIYDSSIVLGNVSVGENCWVGPFTILDGSGGDLTIGDNCNISAGVHIYTHDTVDAVIYGAPIKKDAVKIGSNTYIGPNSVISKGVEIGDYVVIGANSFVNTSIPSHSKAFGSPARVVK